MHTFGHKVKESKNIKVTQFDYMSVKSRMQSQMMRMKQKRPELLGVVNPFLWQGSTPSSQLGGSTHGHHVCPCAMLSRSVVSNSLKPRRLQSARLLCPRDFLGKNTAVGSHFILQGTLLMQGSNPHLLCLLQCSHLQASLPPEPLGKPCLSLLSWQILG